MRARSCLAGSLCWLLVASLPVCAQSANYHVELFSGEHHFPDSGIRLLNDGPKVIEAFSVQLTCHGAWVAGTAGDVLDAGAEIIENPDGNGRGLSPGGFWYVAPSQKCRDAKEDEQPSVTAIIYADGTYDGSVTAVRLLKAQRDGIIAAVNYWAERLARENPGGSTLNDLLSDAKERGREDRAAANRYHLGEPLQSYWTGRDMVDRYVATDCGMLTSGGAQVNFRHISDCVARWKSRIDRDSAMENLNAIFSPVSDIP